MLQVKTHKTVGNMISNMLERMIYPKQHFGEEIKTSQFPIVNVYAWKGNKGN